MRPSTTIGDRHRRLTVVTAVIDAGPRHPADRDTSRASTEDGEAVAAKHAARSGGTPASHPGPLHAVVYGEAVQPKLGLALDDGHL